MATIHKTLLLFFVDTQQTPPPSFQRISIINIPMQFHERALKINKTQQQEQQQQILSTLFL